MSMAPSAGGAGASSLFSSPLGIGAGVGALGVGALLAEGPGSLPSQFGQVTNNVPFLQSTANTDIGQGQALVGQGTQALDMAQNGQLTGPQAAQLQQYQSGLTNQSRQMFYSMGQDPDKSTGFVTQTANVDAQVNAMAQQDIQSTIQLGLGEISGGNSLEGTGLGFENAANQALIAAGQAQLQLDTSFTQSLTSAFAGIGQMFGAAAKGGGAAAGGAGAAAAAGGTDAAASGMASLEALGAAAII
jgi:hypothetical protein